MENFERIKDLKKERILERRRLRRNRVLWHMAVCSAVVLILLSVATIVLQAQKNLIDEEKKGELLYYISTAPEMISELLPVDEEIRPGIKLEQVVAVVVHCTEDGTEPDAHFRIETSGVIKQRIPVDEVSKATTGRYGDTVSITCCTSSQDGKLSEETYDALVQLTAWLVGQYDLKIEDILCHHEVEGSICPKYFVENISAWEDFKLDVEAYIEENGVKK